MQFNFSTIFSIAALLSILGIILFLLKRIKRTRLWMPLLRIIELPKRQLPKLKFVPPPFVSFLCFIFCMVALLAFYLRPQLTVAVKQKTSQINSHLFIDLSPSVAAYTDYSTYVKTIAEAFSYLKESGDVTVSSSLDNSILQFESALKLTEHFSTKDFHRSGFQLAKRVTEDMAQLEKVDRLVIASDGAPTTWKNLNWTFYQEDMLVYWLPANSDLSKRKNLFFEKVEPIPGSSSTTSGYEVVIRRNFTGETTNAKLSTLLAGSMVKEQEIEFQPGSQRISIQVFINSTDKKIKPTDSQIPPHFSWELKGISDGLTSDNIFRSYTNSMGRNALLISATEGESMLEEPAHQLMVSLKTIGYRVRRIDHIEPNKPVFKESQVIALLGSGIKSNLQCPSYGIKKNAPLKDRKIWLAPNSKDANFSLLCHCFESLIKSSDVSKPVSGICQDAYDRERFIATAQALGAFQVGGQIGRAEQSLALKWRDNQNNTDVYLFTIPLIPKPLTGLTYGTFPIFVRNFLNWTNQGKKQGVWPRPLDPSLNFPEIPSSYVNVPLLESQLNLVQKTNLPPVLRLNLKKSPEFKSEATQKKEPLPVLKFLTIIVLAFMAFEMVYGFLFAKRYQTGLALLFGFFLFGYGFTPVAKASNILAILTTDTNNGVTYKKLAMEVSSRTSLNVRPRPEIYETLTKKSLTEPWLISRLESGIISNESGEFKDEILLWISRGGFLIAHSDAPKYRLEKFTSKIERHSQKKGKWITLPPDHELMRSFYLLDALPSCGEKSWRAYIFDNRLAILVPPFPFIDSLADTPPLLNCELKKEQLTRVFVNTLMVALATDYKKDQIHLPEILKRLR